MKIEFDILRGTHFKASSQHHQTNLNEFEYQSFNFLFIEIFIIYFEKINLILP